MSNPHALTAAEAIALAMLALAVLHALPWLFLILLFLAAVGAGVHGLCRLLTLITGEDEEAE
jgi:hypothetical protein